MLGGRYVNDEIRAYYDEAPGRQEHGILVSLGVARDLSDAPHAVTYLLERPVKIAGDVRERLTVEHYCFDPAMTPAGKSVMEVWLDSGYSAWNGMRGDPERYDAEKQQVAKAVITKHRHNREKQEHPPLVHINLELAGRCDRWQAFNDDVLARLWTLLQNARSVFQSDCRLLTTYSYRHEKRFYPVRLQSDPTTSQGDLRDCYPVDLSLDLINENFAPNRLRLREDAYTRWALA